MHLIIALKQHLPRGNPSKRSESYCAVRHMDSNEARRRCSKFRKDQAFDERTGRRVTTTTYSYPISTQFTRINTLPSIARFRFRVARRAAQPFGTLVGGFSSVARQ